MNRYCTGGIVRIADGENGGGKRGGLWINGGRMKKRSEQREAGKGETARG